MQEVTESIKEFKDVLDNVCTGVSVEQACTFKNCNECKAKALYNAGYRKQEWISVEERLPTKDEYLNHHKDGLNTLKRITVAYMTDTIEYAIGCYDGYKWLNQLCNRVIKDVIAWKPFELYTPPQMKGE